MKSIVVQPFSSRQKTVRAKISDEAWNYHGLSVFNLEHVPFSDSTSAWFAKNITELLLSRLTQLKQSGRELREGIHVYEFGVGTGVLSKRILDILKIEHPKIYKKITLHISDISKPAIEVIKNTDIFKEHEEHVSFEVMDATKPTFKKKPILVYHSYLLASLSPRHIHLKDGNLYEIQIETSIAEDAQIIDGSNLPPKTLNSREIIKILFSENVEKRLLLAPQILNQIIEKTRLVPIDSIEDISSKELEDLKSICSQIEGEFAFNYNFLARKSTREILENLDQDGLLLISDFGRTFLTSGEVSLLTKYGIILAFSVDFPIIQYIAKDLNLNHTLTSHQPGHTQQLLIDKSKDHNVADIFTKLFAKDYTRSINVFLEKAKNAVNGKKLVNLYDALPEDVKDYPQLIDYFTGLLLKTKGYNEVIKYTDRTLIEYPHLASSTYQRRGVAFQNLGHPSLAEKDYKMAIKLSEYDPISYALLTDLHTFQTRYTEALEAAKLYLKYSRKNDYPETLQTIRQIREKLKFKEN